MNSPKILAGTFLGALFLFSLPTISQAGCAEIKEQYWKCARSAMTGEACDESENIAIPPECLKAGSESPKNNHSSNSSATTSNFFNSKKDSTPVDKKESRSEKSKKPVKIINIKPLVGKTYLETEEDVNHFTTKLKEEVLNALKEGKKVRLQLN